jgi:hypothetical protein
VDELKQASLDAKHMGSLDRAIAGMAEKPVRVDVPAFAHDVHDLQSLDEVARTLVREPR